jgi:hypothetical protein
MEEKWHELRDIETQRSDIIAKLQRIEEKKSSVSAEVYGKVKKDYEDKLKQVDEQMAQHVDLVKKELAKLDKEEEKAAQQEKEIKFKMEESELRYSIGEYDEASYKKMLDENNEDMSAINSQLKTLRERKKWLRDFVELKSIEETIEEAIEEAIEPAKEPAVPEKTKPAEPEEAKEETKPEKEIEIEEHILEEEVPEEVAKLDELLIEEESVSQEVSEEQEPTVEPPGESSKAKKDAGARAPCPKCGHMNSLDSWYCEKCGAEILDTQSSQ